MCASLVIKCSENKMQGKKKLCKWYVSLFYLVICFWLSWKYFQKPSSFGCINTLL